jgi:hypothetical protein
MPNTPKPKIPVEKEWESVADAAEATDLSQPTIYAAIGRGEILARKVGRRTIVNVASRRRYIDSLPLATTTITMTKSSNAKGVQS